MPPDFSNGLILGLLIGIVATATVAVLVVMAERKESMGVIDGLRKDLRDRDIRDRDEGEWWKRGGEPFEGA